jgi:predicted dehydrogenase
MSDKRIRWGLVGGGADSLIGIVHRIAASMGEDCQLVGGIFSARHDFGRQFALALALDPERVYSNVDALIEGEKRRPADERMSLITVATPNYLHYCDGAEAGSGRVQRNLRKARHDHGGGGYAAGVSG